MQAQIAKTLDETTDQVISVIEQAQDVTVGVVTQVTETVAKYVPEVGKTFKPEEAVASGFQLSVKAVDAGRKAALSLLGSAPAPKKAASKTA